MGTRKTVQATLAITKRALRNVARKPQFAAPLIIFPLLLLAVNSAGLAKSTSLSGFPEVHGFLDFQLSAAITQSLLIGGVSTGIATALEIESGFFSRFVAAPIPRIAIVVGRLLATLAIASIQVLFFLLIGLVFGAEIQGGVLGLLVVLAIGSLAGVGFGAIGMTLALRARNASTVQGVFPLAFVLLFMSSAFFPKNLLSQPSATLATYNPISYIANGMRQPIIDSVYGSTTLYGFLAALAVAVGAVLLSINALQVRLREE